MARLAERLSENVDGEFYVDRTCIDCATCRLLVPAVFGRSEAIDQSYVARQPATDDERHRAAMALVACPTASIGTVGKLDVQPAVSSFPEPIAEDVSFCGYTHKDSFGAWSYLVRRPEGNVLVDSPRAARPLLGRIAALGGVRWMFLTHRDDVADHAKIRARFGCERILHRDDVTRDTASVERSIEGRDPVRLADDLLVVPVPGHTRGSAALLYRDTFLFTGDHLWARANAQGELHASRGVCWYSWAEQTRSVERLLDLTFEWVLPGHGARFHATSADVMRAALERLLGRMRRTG